LEQRIGWAESKCDYTELVALYDTSPEIVKPELPPETSEKEEEKPETPLEPETTNEKDDEKDSNSHKPLPDEPTHEEDKHVDKPSEVDEDASEIHSFAAKTCSGTACRASVIAALVGVMFVAIFVGRSVRGRRGTRYHAATELEVPTLHLDEDDAVDFSTRYRDHPEGEEYIDEEEDDVVAEEGVGYEDDDELDPHEIA
jgi:hypothetical protein